MDHKPIDEKPKITESDLLKKAVFEYDDIILIDTDYIQRSVLKFRREDYENM